MYEVAVEIENICENVENLNIFIENDSVLNDECGKQNEATQWQQKWFHPTWPRGTSVTHFYGWQYEFVNVTTSGVGSTSDPT